VTLQDKLDAAKAAPPHPTFRPEFGLIAARTISALVASGQAARALKVGDRAPAFDLPDQDAVVLSSADLLKKGALVLSFLPGRLVPLLQHRADGAAGDDRRYPGTGRVAGSDLAADAGQQPQV
jgi:hypothetical protein